MGFGPKSLSTRLSEMPKQFFTRRAVHTASGREPVQVTHANAPNSQPRRRRFGLLLMLGAASALRVTARDTAAEQLVKAAYLYKMLAYVEWPAGVFERAESPLTIGVAASNEVAAEISRAVDGKTVQGRRLEVRHVRGGTPPAAHVLFIGAAGAEPSAASLLASVRGKPIFTLTESEADFKLGAAVNFVVVDDKVRFDVSLANLEAAGLKLGVRLLGVARNVQGAIP